MVAVRCPAADAAVSRADYIFTTVTLQHSRPVTPAQPAAATAAPANGPRPARALSGNDGYKSDNDVS